MENQFPDNNNWTHWQKVHFIFDYVRQSTHENEPLTEKRNRKMMNLLFIDAFNLRREKKTLTAFARLRIYLTLLGSW